jgi:hypothetical protein
MNLAALVAIMRDETLYQSDRDDASNRIVMANLGLVYEAVRRFHGRGMTRDELISEGIAAMLRCLKANLAGPKPVPRSTPTPGGFGHPARPHSRARSGVARPRTAVRLGGIPDTSERR